MTEEAAKDRQVSVKIPPQERRELILALPDGYRPSPSALSKIISEGPAAHGLEFKAIDISNDTKYAERVEEENRRLSIENQRLVRELDEAQAQKADVVAAERSERLLAIVQADTVAGIKKILAGPVDYAVRQSLLNLADRLGITDQLKTAHTFVVEVKMEHQLYSEADILAYLGEALDGAFDRPDITVTIRGVNPETLPS